MDIKEAVKVSKNIEQMGENSVYANKQYAIKLAKILLELRAQQLTKPADDTISVSKGEWEAMKKDAERYRFIIKRGLIQIFDRQSSVSYKPKEETDAAIDAAIQGARNG
jgi:hypothetical protein